MPLNGRAVTGFFQQSQDLGNSELAINSQQVLGQIDLEPGLTIGIEQGSFDHAGTVATGHIGNEKTVHEGDLLSQQNPAAGVAWQAVMKGRLLQKCCLLEGSTLALRCQSKTVNLSSWKRRDERSVPWFVIGLTFTSW